MKAKIPRLGKKINSEKGATLLLALIVMMTLSIIGGALLTLIFTRSITVQLGYDRLRAMYLAEAAFSKALYELKLNKDIDGDGLGNIPPTKLGAGYFYAENDYTQLTIHAVGVVNDVERSLRIKYTGNL